MIALDKFRELLGQTGICMTDEEVEHVRALQYQFADLLFDNWLESLEKKRENKKRKDTCI